MLKLTTADYRRPNGKNIQRSRDSKDGDEWGVSPSATDVVKMSDDDWKQWRLWRRDRDIVKPHSGTSGTSDNGATAEVLQHDPPLRRAVEYIDSQIKADKPEPAQSRG